jgi:hypothetical protein
VLEQSSKGVLVESFRRRLELCLAANDDSIPRRRASKLGAEFARGVGVPRGAEREDARRKMSLVERGKRELSDGSR